MSARMSARKSSSWIYNPPAFQLLVSSQTYNISSFRKVVLKTDHGCFPGPLFVPKYVYHKRMVFCRSQTKIRKVNPPPSRKRKLRKISGVFRKEIRDALCLKSVMNVSMFTLPFLTGIYKLSALFDTECLRHTSLLQFRKFW
jgi:hypothetical protein